MTNNKARVAAQTASVGNQDMMSFMPSSLQTQGASSQHINIDNNDQLNTNTTTGDTSGMVPDPLTVRTVLDRGESMDDFAFNESLDAFLTDPGSYDDNDITQQGIILPQPPTPAATAMETLINGGINVSSDPLLDSFAAAVGGGRKRKAPPTRLLSDMSSITNSSGSSEIPRLSSAPLHQQGQQQSRGGSAPAQQQPQVAAPNLNYSARSIIQLPPGMFANQQPISVSTTACPGPTVQQGVGNNTTLAQGISNRLYSSSLGVGGGVGGAQQVSALGNAAGVQQQQLAIQVASLTIPPHNSSTTATSGASSGMADLMSQISLPTTQNSTQVQGQSSSSQVQGQLQIPGISTNPWDALMANAATSAVQQPSTASALQQAAAAAAVYPPQAAAALLPSAVPSSLSAAKGQRRPSLPKAPLLSNNMQRKRPYEQNHRLAVSEDGSERKKRRNERNMREQERSQKITERISELKNVLSEAGVHFKPDRYSTLVSVVSYIKTLQQRSALLDEEHRKLLDTIAGADKLVKANGGGSLIPSLSGAATASKAGSNNPILPLSAKGIIPVTAATTMTTVQIHEKTANDLPSVASSSSLSNNDDEEYLMFVKGIDYKSIFTNCGVALAIASVDGRFVDGNDEFLKITNYTRTELLGDDSPRRTSLPHPQDDISPPSSSSSLKPNGQKQQGQAVTVSTTASTNKSSPLLVAVKKTPDVPASNSTCSHDRTSSPPPTTHSTDRPPKEIHMRKQHLSLFNLLGGKDMEAVYSAMSRMLRAPEHYSSSTAYESGGMMSDLTRSGAEESSSGNEGKKEAAISRYTVDHWSGQVVHTRRKNHMLHLNISLVRTATGRPKFFNVSLSEVEKTPKEVKV